MINIFSKAAILWYPRKIAINKYPFFKCTEFSNKKKRKIENGDLFLYSISLNFISNFNMYIIQYAFHVEKHHFLIVFLQLTFLLYIFKWDKSVWNLLSSNYLLVSAITFLFSIFFKIDKINLLLIKHSNSFILSKLYSAFWSLLQNYFELAEYPLSCLYFHFFTFFIFYFLLDFILTL